MAQKSLEERYEDYVSEMEVWKLGKSDMEKMGNPIWSFNSWKINKI